MLSLRIAESEASGFELLGRLWIGVPNIPPNQCSDGLLLRLFGPKGRVPRDLARGLDASGELAMAS